MSTFRNNQHASVCMHVLASRHMSWSYVKLLFSVIHSSRNILTGGSQINSVRTHSPHYHDILAIPTTPYWMSTKPSDKTCRYRYNGLFIFQLSMVFFKTFFDWCIARVAALLSYFHFSEGSLFPLPLSMSKRRDFRHLSKRPVCYCSQESALRQGATFTPACFVNKLYTSLEYNSALEELALNGNKKPGDKLYS